MIKIKGLRARLQVRGLAGICAYGKNYLSAQSARNDVGLGLSAPLVDKIRLHLAGKLHADYQENLTKGFDGAWLKASGVSPETFIEVVKNSTTDGEVADWVAQNVKKSETDKTAFRDFIFNRGRDDDDAKARLKMRKAEAGLAQRDDIQRLLTSSTPTRRESDARF